MSSGKKRDPLLHDEDAHTGSSDMVADHGSQPDPGAAASCYLDPEHPESTSVRETSDGVHAYDTGAIPSEPSPYATAHLGGDTSPGFSPSSVAAGDWSLVLGTENKAMGSRGILIGCHRTVVHGDEVLALGCMDIEITESRVVVIGNQFVVRLDEHDQAEEIVTGFVRWLGQQGLPDMDEEWAERFLAGWSEPEGER